MENPYDAHIDGQTNKAFDNSDDEQTGFWLTKQQEEGVLNAHVY